MSSLSSSFLEQFNTKYEAYRLIYDPTRLISLLYSKYGDIEEDFYLLHINQLIYNLLTKFNCYFKEIKYTNLLHDYLKRIYKLKESSERIPKLSDYYKNYHLFFCRPTFRHYKLSKIMCNFQDKKAEIFYKNNYKESKENASIDKEENNIKKTSSFSISSFDNITNNKIIFDKQTKKLLDKSETELKNNNYYNTLILETSRSNFFGNNGLISKRIDGENSFENCIHALIDYQYNKNKNKKNKKLINKSKKLKNIIINNSNSNSNMNKFSKINNNISQSQRESQKFYNFKITNNNSKILNNNKINKINSSKNSNTNKYINKIIKNKHKKKILYTLSNNRYNTSTSILLNNKKIINNIKEYNINYPITTKNKDLKTNKIYIYSTNNTINNIRNNSKNNSNIMTKIYTNSNYGTNSNSTKKNLKLGHENNNNSKKFSKLTEYLKQTKIKNENFNNKNSLHKKNCLSIGDESNKNLIFNINNKSRITKKKMMLNKNLKLTITNVNINSKKYIHIKNKTFDYNSINQTHNNLIKNNNIVITEEYNTLLNKKVNKNLCKINADKNIANKLNYYKINKLAKSKKQLTNNSSKKNYKKISVTQNTSKEKNKKHLIVKILNPNFKKKNYEYYKEKKSPKHKKNKNSVYTHETNINKESLIKSNKITKNNFSLSPNAGTINNVNINNNNSSKNVGNHVSPTNQLFNSIVYFKRNIQHNSSENSNHIYIKKSIPKDNKIINYKKDNNLLINSCKFSNTNKELYHNISLPLNNNNNNNNEVLNNNIKENKNPSRNKKKISIKNFNNSKKNNLHNKTNSSVNSKSNINSNLIINGNININNDNSNKNIINSKGNINISIKKNNINIKDSILHIDKIYIKKENNNKRKKIYETEDGFHNKKTLEMKVREEIIKTVGNNLQMNQEKMKSMDYSSFKVNYSPKVINVHRNYNLIHKNNKENKK